MRYLYALIVVLSCFSCATIVHEFGHFIAVPKRLWSKCTVFLGSETLPSIRFGRVTVSILPFGGWCWSPDEMMSRAQRLRVIAGGATANFVVGAMFYGASYLLTGTIVCSQPDMWASLAFINGDPTPIKASSLILSFVGYVNLCTGFFNLVPQKWKKNGPESDGASLLREFSKNCCE